MKKKAICSIVFSIFFCTFYCAGQQSLSIKDTTSTEYQLLNSLLGTWEIDLRPSPNASPYMKEFTVSKYEDGVLNGIFYDTPFKNGRINTSWGKIYFAFTTADNSGTYYHSGYLEDGKLLGSSFSPARGFMLPWFSVKKK